MTARLVIGLRDPGMDESPENQWPDHIEGAFGALDDAQQHATWAEAAMDNGCNKDALHEIRSAIRALQEAEQLLRLDELTEADQ